MVDRFPKLFLSCTRWWRSCSASSLRCGGSLPVGEAARGGVGGVRRGERPSRPHPPSRLSLSNSNMIGIHSKYTTMFLCARCGSECWSFEADLPPCRIPVAFLCPGPHPHPSHTKPPSTALDIFQESPAGLGPRRMRRKRMRRKKTKKRRRRRRCRCGGVGRRPPRAPRRWGPALPGGWQVPEAPRGGGWLPPPPSEGDPHRSQPSSAPEAPGAGQDGPSSSPPDVPEPTAPDFFRRRFCDGLGMCVCCGFTGARGGAVGPRHRGPRIDTPPRGAPHRPARGGLPLE